MIILNILCTFFFIVFCGFSLAIIEIGEDVHKNYQKHISNKDFKKFKQEVEL